MAARRAEEYIETIYDVVQRKGYAKVTDVSRILNVGLSAVTEMFQKLGNEGYVNYEKYSGVTLTKKGEEIAIELTKKHKVLRDFFVILGLDEKIADDDACNIEHVVKPETMKRLTKFVDFIQSREEPLWLERFKTYYETGELPECPRTIKKGKRC
ncbi:MAG: metal-dependent transcriptional regulator [Candidatus Thermoplasmatota archaeon]|nr:metal-dependent transcriptional regulator [Candidatus Thermoplasmatota archaeon]